jgi:hypothetical protein
VNVVARKPEKSKPEINQYSGVLKTWQFLLENLSIKNTNPLIVI